ncbi:YhgE/Pip domain-containing protein [Bifidobacterium catulorum]|uniref:YhgE/Pip domain-containing protein n=2 Tax=Bifidobacterium catulorum TaxID=1630173 RepID=A0A2U2MQ98_9BIFI|nr:YhgE/Pip domain-containing protein [Bifidobacterium catulorum]
MRTIMRIFRRDILRLLKNPVAVVITLGVALIPSLYAWFNIIANWDPYSNTGNIQVAVANDDRGTSNETIGELNAGKQVVEQLRHNSQLGWRFVDAEQARQGVQSGEYYAAIVIPQDFSGDLVGIIDGDRERPTITYYVNEKKNAIAPKITDQGANTIDRQINQTFISTLTSTVANMIRQAGGDAQRTLDNGRDGVDDDLRQGIDDVTDAQTAIDSMTETLDAADTTLDDANTALAALDRQIASVNRALTASGDALGEARKESLRFSTTLDNTMAHGASDLGGIGVAANTAAGGLVNGFNTTQNGIDKAVAKPAAAIADLNQTIDDLRTQLKESSLPADQQQRINDRLDAIAGKLDEQQRLLDGLQADGTTITNGGITATQGLAGAVNTAANTGATGLNTARNSLNTTVTPSLLAGMDSFSAMTGTMGGTLSGLTSTVAQSRALIGQLRTTLDQTSTTLDGTARSLDSVIDGLNTTRTDVNALGSSAIWQKISGNFDLNSTEVGEFMASPVNLVTQTLYPVANYGSAVTPFYTNLALWVGGFVLIAIYKLEVDREGLGKFHATQAYFGRWLLLVTVGILQALIVTVGDLVIGIQCRNPAAFILAGVAISFVYVNIIYALAVTLKHIGKAVAVILVIIQIPGSSGMYPIEMMPDFFQRLNPFLPFTYGINAMRETIGGAYGGHYWHDFGTLVWFLVGALFVGVVARPYLLNLNALFDRRLWATDLMVAEKNTMTNDRFRLVSVIKLLMGVREYRDQMRRRAHQFFKIYPHLIRAGLVMICILPLAFLVLMFSVESKILMLTAWITSIILIDVYLIVVEYMYESFARQIDMSVMEGDEFRRTIIRRLNPHSHAYAGRGSTGHAAEDGRGTGRAQRAGDAKTAGDAEDVKDVKDVKRPPRPEDPAPDHATNGKED